ncbi:MAG: hypothetical protein HZB42_09380 [Sphingobacteriales bacterium]|nr:hypothetical protein [Sphingobacteriales bacterium]
MKKNLVLGILDNYSFHQLKKFFLSINTTGFPGDIYMLVGSNTTPRTIRLLKKHAVNTILFRDLTSLPAENLAAAAFRFPQPINYFNFRHYLYYDFLKRHKDKYEYVLLTDVRDVYFQRDPFDFEKTSGLYCALEGKTKKLKDCRFNGPWMEFIYGRKVLDEIGDNIISCAGTTWGKVDAMLDYLTRMLQEIEKLKDAKKSIDQAIHNYMIWKHMLPDVKFLNNDDGVVLTLSYEHDYTIGADDKVRASNGRIVNVLHQFDRMADLGLLSDKLYRKNNLWNFILHRYYRFELLLHKILLKLKLRNKNIPNG